MKSEQESNSVWGDQGGQWLQHLECGGQGLPSCGTRDDPHRDAACLAPVFGPVFGPSVWPQCLAPEFDRVTKPALASPCRRQSEALVEPLAPVRPEAVPAHAPLPRHARIRWHAL